MEKLYFNLDKYEIINYGGQNVLISDEYKQWMKVTRSGLDIIKRMNGKNTIEEIAHQLREVYDIPEDILLDDCKAFVNQLEKAKMWCRKTGEPQLEPDKQVPLISEIYLDVIGKCNNRCKYCYKSPSEEEEVPYDIVVKKIEDVKKSGLIDRPIVYVTGGEPLLHSQIFRILKYLKDKRYFVVLCTDGKLICPDTIERIAELVDMVQLPLDHPEEEINDQIRGKGSYNWVMNAIEFLNDKDVPFIVSITPSIYNIKNIHILISLAYEKEALGCTLNEGIKVNEDGEDISVHFSFSHEEYLQMHKDVNLYSGIKYAWRNNNDKLEESQNIFFVLMDYARCANSPASIRNKTSCGMGQSEVYISKRGYSPCHLLNIPQFRKKDILEIPNCIVEYKNIKKCSECLYNLFCLGGCRAKAFYESNDVYAVVSNCEENKEYYSKMLENIAMTMED